jgi:hypothetical protein
MENRLVRKGMLYQLPAYLLLLLSTSCFATNYYVSSTGNDGNSGTSPASPWATITKANTIQFLPGDALLFEGGQTFSGNIYLPDTDANDPALIFTISSYGTGRATINAGSSYGFYAYNTQGFSVSNLIFDGNSSSTNINAGIMVFSDLTGDIKYSNISISNVEVKNFGAEGVKIYTTKNLTGFQNLTISNLSVHDVMKNGIIIYGFVSQSLVGWQHKNITISNCEVYNVPGSPLPVMLEGNGIVMEGVDGGVIQNCVAHDNGQNNSNANGPAGIWSLESNNITIQYCESYHIHNGTGKDGIGFDFDGGVNNSIMQYNYSHDNDGTGFLMGQYTNARAWSNNTVRYNISENDGVRNEGGIGLFKGPGTTMNGAFIYNNTIYVSPQTANPGISAMYILNWNTGINNVNFYNNIFITTGGMPFINIPVGYSASFTGNLYWSSGSPFLIKYQGVNYASLSAWRAASGNEVLGGIGTGYNNDPLLSNEGSGGTIGFGNSLMSLNAYKIQSISSPAYHTALDLGSLFAINPGVTDLWTTILPGGNSNDLGANQLSTILPVKLLDFHGSCSGLEQDIFWATAEESEMKSFGLMYSGDGVSFRKLADITPRGSHSEYSYVHAFALPGNNYYQLTMTDLDGTVTNSPVVNIKCENVSQKINVWPNPFSRYISVSMESTSPAPVSMVLFDAMGKIISRQQAQLQKGNNRVVFNGTDNLPVGNYYLQVVYQDKAEHFKLLKAAE